MERQEAAKTSSEELELQIRVQTVIMPLTRPTTLGKLSSLNLSLLRGQYLARGVFVYLLEELNEMHTVSSKKIIRITMKHILNNTQ